MKKEREIPEVRPLKYQVRRLPEKFQGDPKTTICGKGWRNQKKEKMGRKQRLGKEKKKADSQIQDISPTGRAGFNATSNTPARKGRREIEGGCRIDSTGNSEGLRL